MFRRTVSGIMFTSLLTNILALAFVIQPVGASDPIYIRADGRIDPPTALILTFDNITYAFIGNINDPIVVERDNIVIDGAGYTLQGSGGGIGIDLSDRNNVTIENTTIKELYYGIYLDESSNNSMAGNNITNNYNGIWSDSSSDNRISKNNITKNTKCDIWLVESTDNNLSGNSVVNSYYGIMLGSSTNNRISGNNISDSYYGIVLCSSTHNNIIGNMFFNDGLIVWDSHDNVVEGNAVNGRTLVYLEDVSDHTVDDAGQVILVNCDHIKVENLNLSNATMGIQLWRTSYTTIVGNTITSNSYVGIWFGSSSINRISGNNLTSNNVGIWLDSSSNDRISENNVDNNYYGIMLGSSTNNRISGNNVDNNYYGVVFDSSTNNSIYHNDFINNMRQVYSSISLNVWDDGYPSGGNYWSDYAGIDLHNGINQEEVGSDWIGDSSYTIDQNNTDRYPLMHRFALEAQEYEVAYRDLLHQYSEMYSELVALNSTHRSLLESINNLTMTCDLTRDNLQEQINSLIDRTESLSNQVNNLLNFVYVLAGLSVILTTMTVYLATRKPKIITQTETETGKETG